MEYVTSSNIPILLVTANVGSIFEEPDSLLKSWVTEFLFKVRSFQPLFLALHCQEVGGKNYEESMKHVDQFVKSLIESEELSEYIHYKIFLDEDFTSTAKFTALGNLYFIHKSLKNCQIWDFKEKVFVSASGQNWFSGSIEDVAIKEKDKFPKDYFPDCKWSRKGFMRTRWRFAGVTFDLMNIHLFHDASNLTAMSEYPSYYTKVRRDALQYTLDRVETDEFEKVPFFLFGDFNFRLNTGSVIKKIAKNVSPYHVKHNDRDSTEKLLYRNSSEESPFLTVEKKVFDLVNQEDVFYVMENQFDVELDCFKDRLLEHEITFPPSYPFTEDMCGKTYMKTRCPSWCDRILFSPSAKDLFNDTDPGLIEYQMIGPTVPMGDHKPIFLSFFLKPGNSSVSREPSRTGDESIVDEPIVSDAGQLSRSNPCLSQVSSKGEDRKSIHSLLPARSKIQSRSPQWLQATQTLLKSLRLRDAIRQHSSTDDEEPKQRVHRLSSRLTSHHSSSSEEWYSELQLVSEASDPPEDQITVKTASRPDVSSLTEEPAVSVEPVPPEEGKVATEVENSSQSETEGKKKRKKDRRYPKCHIS